MQTETLATWTSWLVGAYLVGSVPFGFLIGKMRGVDVRTVGSKNIGATNVYRTVGKKWGLLAFLCDFLKGFAPTMLVKSMYPGDPDLAVATGIACVVGHTLTVFMRFKGGKGVATAFGMLMAVIPLLVTAAFVLWALVVWVSHYISLGSCIAAAFLGAAIWFMPCTLVLKVAMTILAVWVIWKHRSNIVRLAHGCENKIY